MKGAQSKWKGPETRESPEGNKKYGWHKVCEGAEPEGSREVSSGRKNAGFYLE